MNQQLDTPEQAAAFRSAYQADVYAKALSLTRNEAGAAALTDCVFAMMEQRFASRVLPTNCLSYLRGQTTLLYARQSDATEPPAPAATPTPVAQAPAVVAPKAFRVRHVRRMTPAPVVIPASEIPEVLNVTETADIPAVQAAPDPQPDPQPVSASVPIVEAATREETIFDEDKTALWLPGENFDIEKHTEAQEAFRAKPKDTSNKRSTKLTIFNTFLFLCVIAAAIFLCSELGLLPRLF